MFWKCGFEGPGGHFLPANDKGDIGGGGSGEEGASEVEASGAGGAVVVLVVDGDLRHAYSTGEGVRYDCSSLRCKVQNSPNW